MAQKSKIKNFPWTAINGVFESIEEYIKKSHNQPSLKELQTDFHSVKGQEVGHRYSRLGLRLGRLRTGCTSCVESVHTSTR
jgi:hypothetical protein